MVLAKSTCFKDVVEEDGITYKGGYNANIGKGFFIGRVTEQNKLPPDVVIAKTISACKSRQIKYLNVIDYR